MDTIKKQLVWLFYFCRFVKRQFVARRGLQNASSLAYTTLLSIVPLVGVLFSFFGNYPVFREIVENVQDFVFVSFVPGFGFGGTIQKYLIGFSVNASKLTATGIVLLVIIALMMMSTIESALNHIWNVMTRRNAVARFTVYWSILTVGPILVGFGLYSTSYLLATPVISSVDSALMLKSRVLTITPFITSSVAFTLMYILVPNCRVNRRYAAIGGVIAALLFELAKYGFGSYIKAVPTYQAIYGAVAVIPIFLIWIYVSWLIVLLGAQIAYSLSVFRLVDADRKLDRSMWEFTDVYKIVAELWQAQRTGKELTSHQLWRTLDIPHLMINQILALLQDRDWVHRTSSGAWILKRDLGEMTLLDLYRVLPCKFPEQVDKTTNRYLKTLQPAIKSHEEGMQQTLDVPLSTLLRETLPPAGKD